MREDSEALHFELNQKNIMINCLQDELQEAEEAEHTFRVQTEDK